MRQYQIKETWFVQLKSAYWRMKFSVRPVTKRLLDVTGALLMALSLSPMLFIVALLIKLESKGPVFFKQQRVGLDGSHFTMWKFRSMVAAADDNKHLLAKMNEMQNGVLFKMKQDPRVTKIGRTIRKLSIDELPQLYNVIRGDMSLVGPRPPLANEVAQYTRSDHRRLAAVPGLTCFWQVCGRSDIPFEKQVELDVKYIEAQSLWLDIALLIKTIPAVLLAKGAY